MIQHQGCSFFSVHLLIPHLLAKHLLFAWPCTRHPLDKDEPLQVGAKGFIKAEKSFHFWPFDGRVGSALFEKPSIHFPLPGLQCPDFSLRKYAPHHESPRWDCQGTLPFPSRGMNPRPRLSQHTVDSGMVDLHQSEAGWKANCSSPTPEEYFWEVYLLPRRMGRLLFSVFLPSSLFSFLSSQFPICEWLSISPLNSSQHGSAGVGCLCKRKYNPTVCTCTGRIRTLGSTPSSNSWRKWS